MWEQAAADCAQQRHALRTQNTALTERITHLEQLITRWAEHDQAFLNPTALLATSKNLADAEHALRTEATLIHEETLPT